MLGFCFKLGALLFAPNLLQSGDMFFFVVLQFFVVFAIVLLVLFQSSEDTVSNFASGYGGVLSAKGRAGFLVRLTWVCATVFFLNTILLGKFYAEKRVSIIDQIGEERSASTLDSSAMNSSSDLSDSTGN